jgi:glutathione S-transferase
VESQDRTSSFFPVASVFQHLHPAMSRMVDPQVPQWGEANKPRVMQILEFLDRELKDRAGRARRRNLQRNGVAYVAGADYTAADITALVAVDFMRVSKMAVPDGLSNLQRWHKAVSGRGGDAVTLARRGNARFTRQKENSDQAERDIECAQVQMPREK